MHINLIIWAVVVHAAAGQLRKSIIDEPKCGEIRQICPNLSENDDLLILECLLSMEPARLGGLNEACQHTIWTHVRDLISNERVKETLMPVCMTDFKRINCNIDAEGTYLKCLATNKDVIENGDCTNAISRLENVAFQDYKWINKFLDQCAADITRLHCGVLDENSWGQIKTLSCLQLNIETIDEGCKKEVLRLSEMQSDSIKMDRNLYVNCVDDYKRYCSQYLEGSGRIFKCLMQQDQTKLLAKCRTHLLKRERLIAQDYRVSKGLIRSCREDIRRHKCRRQTSEDKIVRLTQILLCLENAVRNGTKIQQECEDELLDHRRMLMEDYRLSPEIVESCKQEIGGSCKGLEVGGKTIHCLMKLALTKNHVMNDVVEKDVPIGDQCLRALESLMKGADVASDWKVDPVLHAACEPAVRTLCRDTPPGNARIISCLMDNVGAEQMPDDCEDALLQIQYFVARDFKLDPQLFRACHADARAHCHLVDNPNIGPSYGPQVFACLYRMAVRSADEVAASGEVKPLGKQCVKQIRRTMRQRAISVDLHPEIEEVCVEDLGKFCGEKVQRGEEIKCLQTNYDELDGDCQTAIDSFTEMEAEHADLNPYIAKHCRRIVESLCKEEYANDEGDVMDCLIAHKNDPSVKSAPACRASIEHFQFISLKDIKFNYKFKIACKNSIMRLCDGPKSKTDVVRCLSEHQLNATVMRVKSSIPRECKQQLKQQLLQQRENIELNPRLKSACEKDVRALCKDVTPGNSEVVECLKSQPGKLSKECSAEIFRVKKQEMFDNTVDYALNTFCKGSIESFCPHHEKETVLECLKVNRDKKGFSKKCRKVVLARMVEQETDDRLNPSLQENCSADVRKYCANVDKKSGNKQNSPVIECLKDQFRLARLSSKCETEMADLLREQALNLQLNPLLKVVCAKELSTFCHGDEQDDDAGKIEECLKNALLSKRIGTPECAEEVSHMIVQSSLDIHVDPLLEQACAVDVKSLCHNVQQGRGQVIRCLRDDAEVSQVCRDMLMKRLEMYNNALSLQPEGLQDLYHHVAGSPSKHYFFLVLLMFVGTIFVGGLFCGRVTNRHRSFKNK